jgi:ketosteroid isomerase-like protein
MEGSTMRFLAMLLIMLAGPAAVLAQDGRSVASIDSTLNELHSAAARADGPRYFSLFTDDAVYIGTDASERWTFKDFRGFAEPYFSKGIGWTYKPRSRHIVIADVACRCVAWFDELLDSDSYGTSRGTGVLVRKNGSWKISQYALTFPIPNDLAKGMTAEIKAFEAKRQ